MVPKFAIRSLGDGMLSSDLSEAASLISVKLGRNLIQINYLPGIRV